MGLRWLDVIERETREIESGRAMAVAGALPRHLIHAGGDPAIETRVWPGMGTGAVRVLHGVVVDVVEVAIQVVLIANEMLPEAALPDAALLVTAARIGDGRFVAASGQVAAGEA